MQGPVDNRRRRFGDMEIIDTFDFQPNQVVTFVRIFISWHAVRPMQGTGSPAMRRSLTINTAEHGLLPCSGSKPSDGSHHLKEREFRSSGFYGLGLIVSRKSGWRE